MSLAMNSRSLAVFLSACGAVAALGAPPVGRSLVLVGPNSWTNCQAAAVGMGGNLVTIHDAAENSLIHTFFKPRLPSAHGVWIGYNDFAIEGEFVWASGENPGFANWQPGQPDGGAFENGAEMLLNHPSGGSGLWNDLFDAGRPSYGIAEVDPLPGLVAFFPFEGTPYDASGHNYSITMLGSPQYQRGAVGRAMSFDAIDDVLLVTHSGELSFDLDTDSHTIAFYCKWAGGSGNQFIIQDRFGSNTPVSYNFGFGGNNGSSVFATSWYGIDKNHTVTVETANTAFINEWRHVTIAFDATTGVKSMYVDGVLVDTASRPNDTYDDPANTMLTIGAYWGINNSGLESLYGGLLDELRIYNRVLSQGEINELVGLKPCPGDTNGDGFITGDDYDYFAEFFENGCP